jgi:hypothetical protein
VCHTRPMIKTPVHLAEDILSTLGKSRDAIRGIPLKQRLSVAELWLEAEQIRHLVFLRAHLLDPALWRLIPRIGRRRALTIWMVVHEPRLRPKHSYALQGRAGARVNRVVRELRNSLDRGPGPESNEAVGTATVEALRRLASPGHAALLAISLASGLQAERLAFIPRGGFSPCGLDVRIGDATLSLPPDVAPMVRALLIATRGCAGPIFQTNNGLALSPSRVVRMLEDAAAQAGISPAQRQPRGGEPPVAMFPAPDLVARMRALTGERLAGLPYPAAAELRSRIQ